MNTMLIAVISSIVAIGIFIGGYLLGRCSKPEKPELFYGEEEVPHVEIAIKDNKSKIESVEEKLTYYAPDDHKEAQDEEEARRNGK